MKQSLVLLSFLFCSMLNAQTVIQMEEYNGVYRIPCSVNGAKMKFIFDTGASSVCLSMTMAEYLLDNDYISKEDILGTGSSSVADGRIVNHVNINIKDIEIQGIHLYNVKAVVVDGQNAPLLMGQSAIQKLGSVEINGSTLLIKNGNKENDYDYIAHLLGEANEAFDNKLYVRAIEKYDKLYAMKQLSEYCIYKYAWSCYMNNEDEKAEDLIKSFDDFSWFEENLIDVYCLMGHILMAREKYNEAVNYYELSSKKIINYQYSDLPPEETNKLRYEGWMMNFRWKGDCYYYSHSYNLAAEEYRNAAGVFSLIHNVDMDYLRRDSKNKLKKKEPSFRDDKIDYILYQLFICYERSGKWDTTSLLSEITAMARANNKYAKKLCNELNIDPYSDAYNL